MDQFMITKIFEYLKHEDRENMNNVITCYDSLFQYIYKFKENEIWMDSDIEKYVNLKSLKCNVSSPITNSGINKLKCLVKLSFYEF